MRLLLSTRHFTSRPKKLQILLLLLYIRYLSLSEATDKVAIVNQIFHIKGNSAVVNLYLPQIMFVCVSVCVWGGVLGMSGADLEASWERSQASCERLEGHVEIKPFEI